MKGKRASTKEATHVVHIDLPGEIGQCWAPNVDKVQILLAKHRDVLFDIEIFKGMKYEIEADQDYIYDPRGKYLIPAKNKIAFHDGEKLHVWIGRNFKGAIKLTANGRTIGEICPRDTNAAGEADDPSVKPAPITMIVKNSQVIPDYRPFSVMQLDGSYTTVEGFEGEAEKFLQIVEIDPNRRDAPKEVADFFKHGGDKELIPSGGVMTRNWIMNQVVTQSAYVSDNRSWIDELWGKKMTLKTITHKNAGKKMYVILTGSTKVRKQLTAVLYGAKNTKVLAFSFGVGSAQGLRHSAWSNVKGNFSKTGFFAVLFTVTLDVAEWMKDYGEIDENTGKSKQDYADLFIKIGLDISKNLTNSAITSAIMFGVVWAFAGLPIIAIVIGTMVVLVVVGFFVEYIDKRTGASESAAKWLKKSIDGLELENPKDYKNYGDSIKEALLMGELGA